ncbi:MAG TPA: lysophospholipid acyltransferase family protein [Vicinamibacterales bacterium]|nr:lysophospholipid acyltransferase family protein [Vicinamibacterales bacterium]
MTLPLRKRIEARVIAGLVWPVVEGLGGTYHWHTIGVEHLARVTASGHQPIFGFWHGRILAGILRFRDSNITVITSQNFDGEWISKVTAKFGYASARGSTSRGGPRALAQLRRVLDQGGSAAFTLDGPRGPAKIAQPGAVWLSGATGHPVLPFHIEATAGWTLHSWDRHLIPKPGSHVVVAIGEPLYVPSTEPAVVETRRVELEHVLARLELQACEAVARLVS